MTHQTRDIYEDENTIFEEDDFATTEWNVFPEHKRITRNFSIKDDAFFADNIYEYKISKEPLETHIRLIESSTKPPLTYEVKDGVVLEAEISQDKFNFLREDPIKKLKKQVEWNKLELAAGYAPLFLILYKHPEIITNDEFRKFLRQTEQRLKLGLLSVQQMLNDNDKTGLAIMDVDNSKTLWYPEGKAETELEEAETYIQKNFTEPLFLVSSDKYCGISEDEFHQSSEILKSIDKFLSLQPTKSEPQPPNASRRKSIKLKWIVITVLGLVALWWGIWPAIGVFVLGWVITNILSL